MKIYAWVAIGVAISVLLPLIRASLPKYTPGAGFAAVGLPEWWPVAKPYLATGVFSLVIAVLVVAAMGDLLDSWSTAVIAGYTWDSTLQKATTGNVAAPG